MTESTPRELNLLGLAAVFVVLNRITLMLVRGEPVGVLWSMAVWAICALAAHVVLNYTTPQRDPLIIPIVMLLAGWGITLVARLAPAFATRQVIWVMVGTAACIAVTFLPPNLRLLSRYKYSWLTLGLLILSLTILFGVNPSGSPFAPQLWLGFGRVFFQPSELLKLLLVVFMASYLAEKRPLLVTERGNLAYLGPMALMWGFCMVLLVWQRDLGTASLFFLVFLSMLYVVTEEPVYPAVGLVLLAVASIAAYLLFDLVELRIDAWLNPWPDADDRAFQIVQSLLAVAAGGIFGQGVGLGAPTFIPVVHSDFVFAAIAEEWGLFGAVALLLCMAILVMRTLRLGLLNDDRRFHALLAVGVGVLLGIQSLMIVGGVIKLIPLTGVTLPFVSYGGSSMLISFVMVGLLLRISDRFTSALL